MLRIVKAQMSLFPWRKHQPSWEQHNLGHQYRDRRAPGEIVRSVVAYLEWRAGEPWRNVFFSSQRNDRDRWDYLSAVRLVLDAQLSEPARPVPVLPSLNPPPAILPHEREYAAKSRKWLAAALVAVNPQYTDAALLARQSPRKLAHMLACEDVRPAERKRA